MVSWDVYISSDGSTIKQISSSISRSKDILANSGQSEDDINASSDYFTVLQLCQWSETTDSEQDKICYEKSIYERILGIKFYQSGERMLAYTGGINILLIETASFQVESRIRIRFSQIVLNGLNNPVGSNQQGHED